MEKFKKLSRDEMKKISGGYKRCGEACTSVGAGDCDPSGTCPYCVANIFQQNPDDGTNGYCSSVDHG